MHKNDKKCKKMTKNDKKWPKMAPKMAPKKGPKIAHFWRYNFSGFPCPHIKDAPDLVIDRTLFCIKNGQKMTKNR